MLREGGVVNTAGIVVNPASGKDIRRLVAHGSVFDNQEKVRMTRRILLGMRHAGVRRIVYMPDGYGTIPRALNAIAEEMAGVSVEPLEMPIRNTQQDTVVAAGIMETLGVRCLTVLGGDGTSRAACKGSIAIPLLPLSTGTNNVFPYMIEATIAGLAAGLIAADAVPVEQCCERVCLFEILLDGRVADVALVDAAVYDDVFMASRAVWHMEKVPQLFLTRCDAASIGLSAIGGMLRHIAPSEPLGLALRLGMPASRTVHAPIAPGMVVAVGVRDVADMLPGEEHAIDVSPGLVAVDGEREVEIPRGVRAGIRLNTRGPLVVNVRRTMALARERGLFVQAE